MAWERRSSNPISRLVWWIKRQPVRVKAALGVFAGIAVLVFLKLAARNHEYMFVASEIVHSLGIFVLLYKLHRKKSCAGLSLRSQEFTALFLAVRLYCSFIMEYDIHTILDSLTLIATVWVIYMIRFKLKSTYMDDLDDLRNYYVLVPCAVLAMVIHPSNRHYTVNTILWAFCVYLESVSVLPQLRVMQNTKVVEPFTANYVFALGVARFLNCAYWLLQILEGNSYLFRAIGYGWWPGMVILSELVQTFVLADFCYYYVRSVMQGQLVVRLPSGVV